jgi:hypothetical protein
MTIDDIASLLHKKEYRSLKLEKVSDSDLVVESPLELGAKNWLLSLKFKDRQLVFVHIQTSDNTLRPKDAPPDLDFAHMGPH